MWWAGTKKKYPKLNELFSFNYCLGCESLVQVFCVSLLLNTTVSPAGWRGPTGVILHRLASEQRRVALHFYRDHLRCHQWCHSACVCHRLLQNHHGGWLHNIDTDAFTAPTALGVTVKLCSQVFIEPPDIIKERTSVFSLMFVGIGCVSFVTMFLQVGVYSYYY